MACQDQMSPNCRQECKWEIKATTQGMNFACVHTEARVLPESSGSAHKRQRSLLLQSRPYTCWGLLQRAAVVVSLSCTVCIKPIHCC